MKRGFTMIELLIVVGIIGILAAVVLASLGGAKGRGNDTALKSDLSTLQVQGSLYFSLGNTYGSTNTGGSASCRATGTVFNDTGTTVEDGVGIAAAAAVKHAKDSDVQCRSRSTAFVVAGKLANDHYWCVDSVGSSLEKNSAPDSSRTDCSY